VFEVLSRGVRIWFQPFNPVFRSANLIIARLLLFACLQRRLIHVIAFKTPGLLMNETTFSSHESERLLLRRFADRDLLPFLAYLNDPLFAILREEWLRQPVI
jgi:hypothetical protein